MIRTVRKFAPTQMGKDSKRMLVGAVSYGVYMQGEWLVNSCDVHQVHLTGRMRSA